jgi:hypothetical protein
MNSGASARHASIPARGVRCIVERLNQVTAIKYEPMTVSAPVRVWMIVKKVPKVVFGGWAGGSHIRESCSPKATHGDAS